MYIKNRTFVWNYIIAKDQNTPDEIQYTICKIKLKYIKGRNPSNHLILFE